MKRPLLVSLLLLAGAGLAISLLWWRPWTPPPGELRDFNDPDVGPGILVPKTDEGVRIPVDLADAIREMEKNLAPEVLAAFDEAEEESVVGRFHLTLGMWLRHNWNLWGAREGGSPLRDWYVAKGVSHADTICSMILRSFWRHRHGLPDDTDAEIRRMKEEFARRWGPLVELPGVGTAGPDLNGLATARDEIILSLTLPREGGLLTRRSDCPPEDLPERLLVFSERKRDMEHPLHPSGVCFAIRADPAVRWRRVRPILAAAQGAEVRGFRVVFAVEAESDGKEGTLATFLPILTEGGEDRVEHPGRAEVTLASATPDLPGLAAALAGLNPSWKEVPAVLRPADDVPVGAVLRTFDVMLRSGAKWIVFRPSTAGGVLLLLNGAPVPPGGEDAPALPAATRSEDLAGVTEAPPLVPAEAKGK